MRSMRDHCLIACSQFTVASWRSLWNVDHSTATFGIIFLTTTYRRSPHESIQKVQCRYIVHAMFRILITEVATSLPITASLVLTLRKVTVWQNDKCGT